MSGVLEVMSRVWVWGVTVPTAGMGTQCVSEGREVMGALEEARATVKELIDAASAAQIDAMSAVVACHGDKCRESNCESCFGEGAERAVTAANARALRLRAAIAKATGADA